MQSFRLVRVRQLCRQRVQWYCLQFFILMVLSESNQEINPEQVHLSFGDSPGDMVVTWVTFGTTRNSYVWYGILNEGFTYRAEGCMKKFVDGGKARTVRYVHRVTLPDLVPNSVYVYCCGSFQGVSNTFVFRTIPSGTDWSPRVIIYGDMGWKGAAIIPYVQNETINNHVDAIAHIGDIAYNMDSNDGKVGDGFLRMIEPIASMVPYMTAVGNHEQAYNFSHYKNKFTMPGYSEGMFYSFDMGPAHFVAISTEVYYFLEYGVDPIVTQYNWLEDDLRMASNDRSVRPWIIILQHRPFYCSSDTAEDCSYDNNILKNCYINSFQYGLEDLYHRNGVDIVFAGHMHYYERSWPLYKNEVYNGSEEAYRNPGASVHIISGAAGMKSGTETASNIQRDRFPFYSNDNSYTVLNILNKTHLYLEQVSTSRGGQDEKNSVRVLYDTTRTTESTKTLHQFIGLKTG